MCSSNRLTLKKEEQTHNISEERRAEIAAAVRKWQPPKYTLYSSQEMGFHSLDLLELSKRVLAFLEKVLKEEEHVTMKRGQESDLGDITMRGVRGVLRNRRLREIFAELSTKFLRMCLNSHKFAFSVAQKVECEGELPERSVVAWLGVKKLGDEPVGEQNVRATMVIIKFLELNLMGLVAGGGAGGGLPECGRYPKKKTFFWGIKS